jgi:putative membrane protein
MAVIRFVSYLFWAAVFVVLLLFAIKNAGLVTVRFYFDRSWETPLVFIVLASFAIGAVFGVIACVPSLLRQRREIANLRKELKVRAAEPAPPVAPTVPDVPSLL